MPRRVPLSAKKEFARRLKARMEVLNFSQSELARQAALLLPEPVDGQKQGLDFGRDRISHYYRGVSLPRSEALFVLAKALRCNPEDLLPPNLPKQRRKNGPSLEQRVSELEAALADMTEDRDAWREQAQRLVPNAQRTPEPRGERA